MMRFRFFHKKITLQTFRLALPIAFARVLEASMHTTDTVMVGHLGKNAIATVGIALPLWNLLATFFMGTLQALAPLLGKYVSLRQDERAKQTVLSSKVICVAFFALVAVIFSLSHYFFQWMKQPGDLIFDARYFLLILLAGVPAALLNQCLRQVFEVYKKPRYTVIISSVAFFLNIVGNFILIHGYLGFPKLGIYGSAISTVLCWWWMSAAHYFFLKKIQSGLSIRQWITSKQLPESAHTKLFLGQGLPLGAGMMSEAGFFVLSCWMIGQLGKVPLASHHVAISLVSLTFMFAIGCSHATAVLISQAHGLYKKAKIFQYGMSGINIIIAFMAITAITFITFPRFFVGFYTSDLEVLAFAPTLLLVGGLFQIFDGVQVVGFGVLRGMGHSKQALKNTIVSYWLVGMPTGFLFAKTLGFGAQGYWIGFTVGLATASVMHFLSMKQKLAL